MPATSITQRLPSWLSSRVVGLIGAVRERIPPKVQRLGAQTWQRAMTRFPVLGELVQPLRAPFVAAVARVKGFAGEAELMTHDAHSARFVPVEDLASQLTDAADWQTRAHAADTLADVDAPGVVDVLMRALRDPSAEVAAAAAAALAAQRDGRALDALRAVLRNLDGYLSPVTRAAALSGLARRLADTEFGPVFDAINDPDAEVSLAAINAISAIAKRAPQMAAARLLPVVRNESGYFLPLVRLAAVGALARTGVLTATLANELLRTEPDASVRVALERATANMSN